MAVRSLLVLSLFCALAPAREDELALQPAITRVEIESHVRFLASDELRGRATGSPGSRRAAEYLARVFQESGLEPAGDDGYFQTVPMERLTYTGRPSLHFLTKTGEKHVAEWGVDFEIAGSIRPTSTLILAIVKSSEDLPERDVPGRAYFLDGARTDVREWSRTLRAPGACGLLLERGKTKPGRPKTKDPLGSRRWRVVGKAATPRIQLRGDWIDRAIAGEFVSVRVEQPVDRETTNERNVVARIPGVGTPEDPNLAQETIVYTAHYDHVGTDEPREPAEGEEPEEAPDLVFNGADDDASGVAAVLELAGAYAAGAAPARTLVFLLVTGEEIGLLGTEYYLDHPVVPLEKTLINLNFEMLGRPDEAVGGKGRMWLTGYELSTLAQSVEAAGVPIAPDARPEQHFFKRSDNYAFVKRGIVGQTFSTYNMHEDYHKVTDEADRIDYEHMEACVQAAYEGVTQIVDGTIRPQWAEGVDPKDL